MTTHKDKEPIFTEALAITEKMLSAGYGLLPETPSSAMLLAGTMATGLTIAQVEAVYRAMHRAACEQNGEEGQDPFVLIQEILRIQTMN
jgi:hypothetical protein